MAKNNEIKFEIIQHFGVLKERKNGWKKELNKVSWNDEDPKYEIGRASCRERVFRAV